MSSDANLIAARYVTALFDMATENKSHDSVKKDLLVLKSAISQSEELQKFLVNPVITREQADKAMAAVLTAIKASDLTKQFIALLAHQRRLAIIGNIITQYLERL